MCEVPHVEHHEGGGGGQVHLRRQLAEERGRHTALLQHALEGGLLDVQLVARHLDAPLAMTPPVCCYDVVGSDGEGAEDAANVQRQDGPQEAQRYE